MDFKTVYRMFEDDIEVLGETMLAENEVNHLLNDLKEKDPELFFDLDSAIGALVRAYEKQGFNGGLAAVREMGA